MAQPHIQCSFNSGEWAPTLYSRVDLQKFHSGAALLRNFFVDYRGGASTRPGTRYCLQAYKSASAVRLIPFQASQTVGYMLEFGDQYIRPFYNGAPVLETGLNITGVTKANPCVVSVTNTYTTGDVDWVYISGVAGMTQLNGHYYKVHVATGGAITLYDLFGNPVDSTAFGTWTAGGTTQRVYTITSPYAAADLALVKFAQSANLMILCHPSYNPQVLTLIAATNWTITPIVIGTTAHAPTGVTIGTTLAAGTVNYAYVVTGVDSNGQESNASAAGTLANVQDIRTAAGSNTVVWTGASGAVSYNVYKAEVVYGSIVPAGAQFGFIGNCTGQTFVDSNIAPDFTATPPKSNNPFQGAGVQSVSIGTAGGYTGALPLVTFAAAPAGGTTAIGYCVMYAVSLSAGGGTGYAPGMTYTIPGTNTTIRVDSVGAFGTVTGWTIVNPGQVVGSLPSNPVTIAVGNNDWAPTITWGVSSVTLISSGSGYATAPAVTFTAGAPTAAATAVLAPASAGNPAVPAFSQQRLVLAAQPNATNTFNGSQPGSYYNFDKSNPIQADDAYGGTLVSDQLQEIKAIKATQAGLIIFTTNIAWLVTGGGSGTAITPINITANPQSYVGSSDLPPIVSNYDILFVQAKGSIVRDMSYNFYANIFTGTDISILSSHLFYGYVLQEWAFAEEPFKVIWVVRNDGYMLTLTFLKEQELTAWAHSDTLGLYKSVATITESGVAGKVDAVYIVVQRTIQGQSLKYVERFAERIFSAGATDAWCVDAGLQYSGAPATSFTGGEHLAGQTVTGLADGLVITPFVMPANGAFTLGTAASKVTVGLGFTCQLQTLPIDLGEPTVQGKVKKINAVDIRVTDTLGLEIGADFTHTVPMKDLVVGNVSSMLVGQSSQLVTNLVTGDARTFINPTYTVPGQYCIQQTKPFPATVNGVIPQISTGDTAK